MKKLLSLVLALSTVAVLSSSSYADFVSKSKAPVTASVEFTDPGSVSVSISLNTGSAITWAAGIVPGSTQWQAASNYVIMHSTITSAIGGIQMYTDNRNAGIYSYTGSTTTNPAGLVGYSASVPSASSTTLSMCWRLTDNTTNSLTIVQSVDNQLYSTQLGGVASQYPCFLWMKDKSTPVIPSENTTAFVNGEDYITVKDALRGGQHAEGTFGSMPSPDYLYFGANFLKAVSPLTYRSTIYVEAFTE